MDYSGETCLDEGSSMAPHIPIEVITEILAKLPVKSLLKFRVVCKSWCSLISTRQFVRKHLSSSNRRIPKRVIQLCANILTFYSLHDSIPVQESSPVDFHCINNGPFRSFFMGYCDGLLCVRAFYTNNNNTHIFLWNPSTGDSKILPYIPDDSSNTLYHGIHSWGFGYDYNSDDYKVLIVIPSNQSMMFTLRTNSWRRIQDFPLDPNCFDHTLKWSSAIHVNGALHWMGRKGFNDSWSIISLDLTTETYIEVPQPEHYGSTRVEHIGIGASRTGCLCLNVYNFAAPHRSYDLWVMEEYGVRESWTISARIPDIVDGASVLGLRTVSWLPENGDLLLHIYGKLATYNVNKNSVRHHQQPDLRPLVHSYGCSYGDVYVESLVSPNAYSSRDAKETCRLNISTVGSMTRDQS